MKDFYPALIGGIAAGLCVWGVQSLDTSYWAAAVAAAAGSFLGVVIGQKLISR
ncbi:hypothetical protein ACDY97_04250 [Rhizobium mongolense]|uniref:hypothetical protein n=1 Tax=Rhizobium mongolense TaxID=57676 RepID=UPI0035581B65